MRFRLFVFYVKILFTLEDFKLFVYNRTDNKTEVEFQMDAFMDFISGNSIGVYLFIFFGKILEVTIATIRNVLINRGERNKGALIAILEVIIWVVITGTVLNDFTEDILKVVFFCLAFAIGNYLGSLLEAKLALGLSTIQVICKDLDACEVLTETLRSNGIAVTLMDGEGKESAPRKIMIIHLKRNQIKKTIALIRSITKDSVIAVSDLKVINGGFIKK